MISQHQLPEPGQIFRVRSRTWLVEDMASVAKIQNADNSQNKTIPEQIRGVREMNVGLSVMIRQGAWIEDKNYGLGRVLKMFTRTTYADRHHVWFKKLIVIMRDHPLRGNVFRVIHHSIIDLEIQRRFAELDNAQAREMAQNGTSA